MVTPDVERSSTLLRRSELWVGRDASESELSLTGPHQRRRRKPKRSRYSS